MAYTPIKLYSSFPDRIENVVLADKDCAGFNGLCGYGGVGRADDADAEGGVNGVGETESVTDCGTIFGSAQTNGEIIFRRGRGATDFKCTDVSDGEEGLGTELS